jgi:hypothetical protein
VWSERADALLPANGSRGANGALAPTPPPVAVPRFLAASAAAPTAMLATDGKLPELSLIEVQARSKIAHVEARKSRPMLLVAAVGLSMVFSVFFGMYDFAPQESGTSTQSIARRKIRQLYQRSDEAAPLQPFQLLLRDAERAHTRGDDAVAAAKYRQVLNLLRTEGKVKSITDTSETDLELEQALSTLLRGE